MGHLRLGSLPDTVPWRRVVTLLADGADTAAVAAATTHAALRGLMKAGGDDGLAHTVWLLAQVGLAARQPDFAESLRRVGIQAGGEPAVLDLACGFTAAVDHHLSASRRRTDLGEMARAAGSESLVTLLTQRSASLFGTTAADLRAAARGLSFPAGFATLAHDFFARFARRFLTYHLGRELSNHVGGNGRFADPEKHSAFVDQLDAHCQAVAGVVRTDAGDWYARCYSDGGVTARKARSFAGHAVKKLADELKRRGARHG
jgi:hypothetical protein